MFLNLATKVNQETTWDRRWNSIPQVKLTDGDIKATNVHLQLSLLGPMAKIKSKITVLVSCNIWHVGQCLFDIAPICGTWRGVGVCFTLSASYLGIAVSPGWLNTPTRGELTKTNTKQIQYEKCVWLYPNFSQEVQSEAGMTNRAFQASQLFYRVSQSSFNPYNTESTNVLSISPYAVLICVFLCSVPYSL